MRIQNVRNDPAPCHILQKCRLSGKTKACPLIQNHFIAECVEGHNAHIVDILNNTADLHCRRDTIPHLLGGRIGKCDKQQLGRINAFIKQALNTLGDDEGFPGARACIDSQDSCISRYRLRLVFGRYHELCALRYCTVYLQRREYILASVKERAAFAVIIAALLFFHSVIHLLYRRSENRIPICNWKNNKALAGALQAVLLFDSPEHFFCNRNDVAAFRSIKRLAEVSGLSRIGVAVVITAHIMH